MAKRTRLFQGARSAFSSTGDVIRPDRCNLNEPWHASVRQIATGGLHCSDQSQRRQHHSAWRRCAFHSGLSPAPCILRSSPTKRASERSEAPYCRWRTSGQTTAIPILACTSWKNYDLRGLNEGVGWVPSSQGWIDLLRSAASWAQAGLSRCVFLVGTTSD